MTPRSAIWMLALALIAARQGRAEERSRSWDGPVFLTVTGGYQPAGSTFEYSDTQPLFQEMASAEARSRRPGAPALEVGGGVHAFGPVGVGATLSNVHATQSTTLTVSVPHPAFFGRPATVTSADSRSRNELALHLQAIVTVPVGPKLRLGVFGGPTRFWLHQPLVADAELEPTLNADMSFEVAMPNVVYRTLSSSAWGFHAGADLHVRVSNNIGIGAVARYSRGHVHVENALRAGRIDDHGKTVELELGGLSLTGGLKLWFHEVPRMKTKAALLAVLGMLAVSAPAGAEVHVGVLGGSSFGSMIQRPRDDGFVFGNHPFFGGGLVADIPLGRRFSIRLEPMFLDKGGDFSIEPDFFLFETRVTGSFRLSYLELPVLLRFSSGEGSVRPHAMAGPSGGYLVKSRARGRKPGESVEADAEELFRKGDLGLSFGAGLLFPRGRSSMFVEGRYTLGLINIAKDEEDRPAEAEAVRLKTRTIQVLAGVTFRLGRH